MPRIPLIPNVFVFSNLSAGKQVSLVWLYFCCCYDRGARTLFVTTSSSGRVRRWPVRVRIVSQTKTKSGRKANFWCQLWTNMQIRRDRRRVPCRLQRYTDPIILMVYDIFLAIVCDWCSFLRIIIFQCIRLYMYSVYTLMHGPVTCITNILNISWLAY